MIKHTLLIFSVALLLSACSTGPDVELQTEGNGSDEPRVSPCACMPVPYHGPSFEWRAS